MKHKKIIISLSVLAAIGLFGYWFFMKTLRGNSLALYMAGGWGAPVKTRIACAKETDLKVKEKFEKPLNFDQESKNLLKNFWYYSFYRGCLFRNGYDFSGNVIAVSNISQAQYTNKFVGLSFSVPEASEIILDNSLNVELDDRLFISQVQTPNGLLNLHYYTKHDQFDSFEHLNLLLQNIPTTQGRVTEKTSGLINNFSDLHISQDDGNTGLAFLTPLNNLVIIFGQKELVFEILEIEKTLKVLP